MVEMSAQRDMKKLIYWGRIARMDDQRLVKQVSRQRERDPIRE